MSVLCKSLKDWELSEVFLTLVGVRMHGETIHFEKEVDITSLNLPPREHIIINKFFLKKKQKKH